jgi:ribosome-associated toxin RatA of RatAB toxin-antitoxin module
MPKIDVVDEAVIDAPPMAVYSAILDVYAGVTQLFMPGLESKLRGDKAIDCEGAICDVTGHSHGLSTKFSLKVTKVEQGKSIEFEFSGDFLGNEKWTFEPTANGATHVALHYVGGTNRLLFSILSPFVNPTKEHSKAIQNGLKACNSYLCKK